MGVWSNVLWEYRIIGVWDYEIIGVWEYGVMCYGSIGALLPVEWEYGVSEYGSITLCSMGV